MMIKPLFDVNLVFLYMMTIFINVFTYIMTHNS